MHEMNLIISSGIEALSTIEGATASTAKVFLEKVEEALNGRPIPKIVGEA